MTITKSGEPMSDQRLYKVTIPYGWQDPQAHHNLQILWSNLVRYTEISLAAQQWPRDNDRLSHLVNTYDNNAQGLLFVFSDRDTALLFRLALVS